MSRLGFIYMLISGLAFALMSLLVGVVHQLQPSLSVAMTSLVRALVNLALLLAFHWRAPLSLFGDRRPALWLRGLSGSGALITYFAALSRVGIGEASFLNQTSTVWVAVLAPWVLQEETSRRTWLAIGGAMIGMLLLSLPRDGMADDTLGRFLGVFSGFLASIAYLSIRRAGASNGPSVIVFYFTLVSAVICLLMLSFEQVVWPEGWRVWSVLVGVGIMATLGQIYMTRAYKIGPASAVAAMAYASPLLTAILGVTFLGQLPDLAGWVGMLLILLCGVALPALQALPRASQESPRH